MSRKVRIISALLPMVMLFGSCYNGGKSEADQDDSITRVENAIPRVTDPDHPAALLRTFNNMLNVEFTRSLSRASLDSLMTEYRIPGVSIAVINHYKVDWMKAYGEIHAGRGIRVTPDTYFEAGSTTKILTAALVMKLAEEGVLDLDKDVDEYLKSWKIPDSPLRGNKTITTRLLLSHLSGLSEGKDFGALEETVPTLADYLNGREPATNAGAEIVYEPGTRWQYSNFGFIVIQLLLEEHLGRQYAELMQQYIFDPLEMGHSTFAHHEKKAIRDAAIVPHDRNGTPHERSLSPTIKAHGELQTTPKDLAKFAIALMKAYVGEPNGLFSRKTAREMLAVSRRIEPEEFFGLQDMSYGYGAFLLGENDAFCFMHPGSNNPGTSSMLIANPSTGKGAVIMTNGEQGILLVAQLVSSISLAYDWPHASNRIPD